MIERVFFDNVIARMAELNMSRSTLHKKSGVSPTLITNFANAIGNPSLDTMEKIAEALDVPLVELLTPKNPADYPDLYKLTGPRWENLPEGYEVVSATLPEQKAFIMRKWDIEARKIIRRLKRPK